MGYVGDRSLWTSSEGDIKSQEKNHIILIRKKKLVLIDSKVSYKSVVIKPIEELNIKSTDKLTRIY